MKLDIEKFYASIDEKREDSVTIRLSESELNKLRKLSGKKTVSAFVRYLIFDVALKDTK